MKALLKLEWIKTWREWTILIMAIGMPLAFFLFYSGLAMSASPEQQKEFIRNYMLTMTGFSMSSFGFFTFPFMLKEDANSHWTIYLEHLGLPIWKYYLSKVLRVLLYFTCSIVITFTVGHFYRQVSLSLGAWLGATALLLFTGLLYLSFGLLLSQIKSAQVMSILGNFCFLGLAIIGGSWMPIETFPKWVQAISKWTPIYHANQLVVQYAGKERFNGQSFGMIALYSGLLLGPALLIKHMKEVD